MLHIALAAALTCFSPRAHEGDTLSCSGQRVRLWGVDAPELSGSPRCRRNAGWACDPAAMRWGLPARDRLIELTRGQSVNCEQMHRDQYRRVVARCEVKGRDVGGVLVQEGLARDYTRFSHGTYLGPETAARRGQLGMWRR